MDDIQRVKYLKVDKGRFNYQRRVPKNLQPLFVETTWVRPCGDVTYAKAIQKVVTWAEEDDALIERMKDPVEFQKFKTEARRKLDEIDREFVPISGENNQVITRQVDDIVHFETIEKPYWLFASPEMKLLDYLKNPYQPYKPEIDDLKRMIKESKHNESSLEHFYVPPLKEYRLLKEQCRNAKSYNFIHLDEESPHPIP